MEGPAVDSSSQSDVSEIFVPPSEGAGTAADSNGGEVTSDRILTGSQFRQMFLNQLNKAQTADGAAVSREAPIDIPASLRHTTRIYNTVPPPKLPRSSKTKGRPVLKSTLGRALAFTDVLQSRNTPSYLGEQGTAEEHYMKLLRALEERQGLRNKVESIKSWIAAARDSLDQKHKETEELLRTWVTIDDNVSKNKTRRLLREHSEIETLREVMQSLRGEIQAKTAEYDQLCMSTKTTKVKSLERQAKVYFIEVQQLQAQLDKEMSSDHHRRTVAEQQQLAEAKRVAEEGRKRNAALMERTADLQRQISQMNSRRRELEEMYQAEVKKTEEWQAVLWEERKKLKAGVHQAPQRLERLRAEVQVANTQLISVTAELSRTKLSYESKVAQLQSAQADMKGKLERLKMKAEEQAKAKAVKEAELAELQTTLKIQEEEHIARRQQKEQRVREALNRELEEKRKEWESGLAAMAKEVEGLREDCEGLDRRLKRVKEEHHAELMEIHKYWEERQQALFSHLCNLPRDLDVSHVVEKRQMERERQASRLEKENEELRQELARVKAQLSEPMQIHATPQNYHSQLSSDDEDQSPHQTASPRYRVHRPSDGHLHPVSGLEDDTASQITRLNPDRDETESLCRGAGGTGGIGGDSDEDEQQE